MKYVILSAILLSCATNVENSHKHKAGECVYLVEADGRGDKRNGIKVVGHNDSGYIYQWWLYGGGWGDEMINTRFGVFSVFEKHTAKIDCGFYKKD